MTNAARTLVIIGVVAVAAAAATTLWPAGPELQTVDLSPSSRVGGPAMCPWREPEKDMAAFFPGATGYTTGLAVFSARKTAIERRMGPEYRMETTALNTYHINWGTKGVGDVVVRRSPGPHGAIEIVVALDTAGRLAGVRIQREREPDPVSKSITSPAWLKSFARKDANAAFRVGQDIPAVPPESIPAANAVALAVRACMVEMDESRWSPQHVHK